MLTYPNWPIVTQLQPLHNQQGTNTHHSTYLKNHLVTLLHIIDNQILEKVRNRKSVEQNTIDLRTVTNSEDLRCHSRKYTQMTSITNVTQNYIKKVNLFDTTYVTNRKSQNSIQNRKSIVNRLESLLLQDRTPKNTTQTTSNSSNTPNQSQISVI